MQRAHGIAASYGGERATDSPALLTRELLQELLGPPAERDFTVRLWDGTEDGPGVARSRFVLILRHPASLRRLLLPPTQRHFAEAYLRDDIDIEGDIEAATDLAAPLEHHLRSPGGLLRIGRRLLALRSDEAREHREDATSVTGAWGADHTRERDARVVRYHYDVGIDFYASWLDRRMTYSCAFFPSGTEDLDSAQEAKLELICRKLRLRADERLLDIGCGWGSLVIHAAERFGVRAVGITLSEPQAELARERIAAAGLEGRCRIEVRDYRDLPPDGSFDKLASIGMIEHVGRARLNEYFAQAFGLLRPGGLFLCHGIVSLKAHSAALPRVVDRARRRWSSFIERYVFPDAELLLPSVDIAPAERAGFELRDLESLREHYAMTLRHWVSRLERSREAAVRAAGETTYRIWRLYMAGSARAFATGRIGVVQALLAKRDALGAAALPPTRADLYASSLTSAR